MIAGSAWAAALPTQLACSAPSSHSHNCTTPAVWTLAGVSGAGRSAKQNLLYTEVTEGINAYGVTRHRHMPEIEQGLSDVVGKPVTIRWVGVWGALWVDLCWAEPWRGGAGAGGVSQIVESELGLWPMGGGVLWVPARRGSVVPR